MAMISGLVLSNAPVPSLELTSHTCMSQAQTLVSWNQSPLKMRDATPQAGQLVIYPHRPRYMIAGVL